MRILMLLTDGFGGFGGISKFNRDFLTALDASPLVERIYAWPRVIPEQIEGFLPETIVYERKFAGGKFAFLRSVAANLFKGTPVDLVVCGHLNLLPIAWLTAKARRSRLALIIHGIDAWQPTKSRLTNFLAGKTALLVSVSGVSADRFVKWSQLPRDRSFILPNSVDLDVFTPGPKSERLLECYGLTEARVLLTVGRLASEERYKGFDEVLEAMPELVREFPNLKYLIVGDGPDGIRLKTKAKDLGLAERVVFAGRIAEDEKVDHYRLADVYAMPSSGEGFGIVLIEAVACGIPVVGSSIDGSTEALLNGRLGLIVDPKNRAELVARLSQLLSNTNAKTRNALVDEFSVENFNRRVADILAKLNGLCTEVRTTSSIAKLANSPDDLSSSKRDAER